MRLIRHDFKTIESIKKVGASLYVYTKNCLEKVKTAFHLRITIITITTAVLAFH